MPSYTTPRLKRKPAVVAAVYNVDVTGAGEGRFRARCREVSLETVSANAEHDLSHLLTKAGYHDGQIHFWRGSTESLFHPSTHTMGRYRIALGEQFPQRLRRKDDSPEISSESVEGASPERHGEELATPPHPDNAPAYGATV